MRIVHRRGFQHGGGLRALAGRAQRLRVADRIVGIARIGAEFSPSASLSRRQSASLRCAALDEIEPVVSVAPVVLQPASATAVRAAVASIRTREATPTIMMHAPPAAPRSPACTSNRSLTLRLG